MSTIRKELYTVKYFKNNEWKYLPSMYFNPYDTTDDKKVELNKLKSNFPEIVGCIINISNLNNVYL